MIVLRDKSFGLISEKYRYNMPSKIFDSHKRALVDEAIQAENEGASQDEIRQRLINRSNAWRQASSQTQASVSKFQDPVFSGATGLADAAHERRMRDGSLYNKYWNWRRDNAVNEILTY